MKLGKILISCVAWVLLLGPGTMRADDTDVYFDPHALQCGDLDENGVIDGDEFACVEPLVMLTFDMRSNAISSGNLCTFGEDGDCDEVLGEKINEQMLKLDEEWGLGLAGSEFTLFDAIRAVYASVFAEMHDIKLGMMVNHTDAAGAAGGAYVLRGFRSMQEGDANGAKEELTRKLFSLPKPAGNDNGGGADDGVPDPECKGPQEEHEIKDKFGMTFRVSDILINEGQTGVFTIKGEGKNTSGARQDLTWVTQAGSAAGGGVDYSEPKGQLKVSINKNAAPPAQTTVEVPARFDGTPEGDGSESFTLLVSLGGEQRKVVGTICDVSESELTLSDASVFEGGTAVFTVRLSKAQRNDVTVGYTVLAGGGAAGADKDDLDLGELPYHGSVVIPARKTTATIEVPTKEDDDVVVETFHVQLESAAPGTFEVPAGMATGSIRPRPDECEPGEIGASDAHQFQGASLYFELFRYLTGGEVYLGHEGETDFTGGADKDLHAECFLPGYRAGYATGDDYAFDAAEHDGDPLKGVLHTKTPKEVPTGILAWDLGGPKPGDNTNPLVEEKHGDGYQYVSPLVDGQECGGIYAINMMFGVSNDPGKGDAIYDDMNETIVKGGLGQEDGQGVAEGTADPFSDMLRILGSSDLSASLDGDQTVTSYIIRVVNDGDDSEDLTPPFCDGEQKGAAGGQFQAYCEDGRATVIPVSASDLEELAQKLGNLIDSVISKSTSYVAASVPVNVFNRADINDDVFVALFTVDEDERPYWFGNLKKLKIERENDVVKRLVDQNGIDAVGDDGRISNDALTFWTKSGALPAIKSATDVPAGQDEDDKREGVDGHIVPRGGAGQLIPGYIVSATDSSRGNPGLANSDTGARRLYTVASGTGSLQEMDARSDGLADEFASALVISNPEAKAYMCWMRGVGNCTDALGGATPVAHDWLFADAIHSRPLPLNYGARGGHDRENPDIRLLLGTNDGLFHMFQNTTSSGVESGVESWAFMPPKHLLNAARLRSNSPGGLPPHPYGVDGEPVVVVDAGADGVTIDHEDGDTAWVYFAMRRGGSAICALDISNPDEPKSLWSKNCIDSESAGFKEMGMSFSTPVATRVKFADESRQVLIFGGGYHGGWVESPGGDPETDRIGYDDPNCDPNEDDLAAAGCDPARPMKGNAVYIVDAETGALLWKAVAKEDGDFPEEFQVEDEGLKDSIAAEVSVVEQLGIATRAYVGDLGGNVWRLDLPKNLDPEDVDDNRDSWSIRKVAALGGNGTDNRKFFHKIDVVFGIDPAGGADAGFDALLIGSGNRESPKSTTVDDYMFMIKDNDGGAIEIDELANADCFVAESYLAADDEECKDANEQLANGWKLPLLDTGEKMLGTSLTIGGRTFFSTYRPLGDKPEECGGNEGTGRFYSISLFNARPVENINAKDDGGNADPSTLVDRYCDTCLPPGIPPPELVPLGAGSFLLGLKPMQSGISSRYRTHWYEKDVD